MNKYKLHAHTLNNLYKIMLLPVYSENTPNQRTDEESVLSLITVSVWPSDWLWIRVICQHYFQTHSPASIKTKLSLSSQKTRRASRHKSRNIIFMLKDSCSKSLIESRNQMHRERERAEMWSNPLELFYVLRHSEALLCFSNNVKWH